MSLKFTIDCCCLVDLSFSLEQTAQGNGKYAANKIVDIPNDVQKQQQNYSPKHFYLGVVVDYDHFTLLKILLKKKKYENFLIRLEKNLLNFNRSPT